MGATFLSGTIQGAKGVQNLKIDRYDTEFSFKYEAENDELKTFKVYAPTRDDYEVSVEVVDRALQLNCNLIVYDFWIFSTYSGKSYASNNGVPVYSGAEFIRKIKQREKIEPE